MIGSRIQSVCFSGCNHESNEYARSTHTAPSHPAHRTRAFGPPRARAIPRATSTPAHHPAAAYIKTSAASCGYTMKLLTAIVGAVPVVDEYARFQNHVRRVPQSRATGPRFAKTSWYWASRSCTRISVGHPYAVHSYTYPDRGMSLTATGRSSDTRASRMRARSFSTHV